MRVSYQRNLGLIFSFLMVCISSSSCKAPGKKSSGSGNSCPEGYIMGTAAPTTGVTTVGYSPTIQTIVNGKCAMSGCHALGGQAPDLSSYDSVKLNFDNSLLKINAGTMPKPIPPATTVTPLTAQELTDLNNWKMGGYLQIGTAASTAPVAVSYTSKIQGYLLVHCATCHGATRPDMLRKPLTTYAEVFAMGSEVVRQINSNLMPKNSIGTVIPLDATIKAEFTAWQAAGFPENATAGVGASCIPNPYYIPPTVTPSATVTPTATP